MKFYLPGSRATVFFAQDEVVFKVMKDRPSAEGEGPREGVVVRLSFPGSNPNVRVEGLDPQPGRVNNMQGNDPSKWRQNVPTFAGVAYRDLYPGVDLEFRSEDGDLKRVLVLRDPAGAEAVRFRYAGAESLRVGSDGALELATGAGAVREAPIRVEKAGADAPVETRKYTVLDADTVGIQLGLTAD